jgi:membrane-associated phospholipid phosphatase
MDYNDYFNTCIAIRDNIGIFAPLILFLLSILLLRNKQTYLKAFVIGFILNNIINAILKLLIKAPRPSKDQRALEIGIANGERIAFDKYGMPSGHAQNAGFALVYISLIFNSPFITGFYLIISFISMYQRYLYNNHTILQLIIGFLIGAGLGYICYFITNRFIMGNLKTKKDDEYYYP